MLCQKDNEGDTPLHDAISRRRDDLVAMLMEGGGGSIVTCNVPSSDVATNVLSGCERAYDHSGPTDGPIPAFRALVMNNSNVNKAASASIIPKNDNVANATTEVENEKSTFSIMSGQEDSAAGCSAATTCSSSDETSKSMETSVNAVITADTELGFPVIGSPPADLMVVNTNGFNPLQHAALRGNPG